MRILLVDDNITTLSVLSEVLADLGHEIVACSSPTQALAELEKVQFPIILSDVKMPGGNGLDLLSKIKADPRSGKADVIMITGHGDMDMAVDALRRGAYDFLRKPVDARSLAAAIDRSAEHQALLRENESLNKNFSQHVEQAAGALRQELAETRQALRRSAGMHDFVVVSPAMRKIVEEAKVYHRSPEVPVLIEGETGTGKEIIARLVHFGDCCVDTPFVDINCSAISGELFESEFFGYEPGAFTGGQPGGMDGKLKLAANGTIFLDEIGDMPQAFQPKLLRVLESRTYYRIGGVRKLPFNARIVCATNQDLRAMEADGSFRRDLYHRLHVGHIRIPPLRERREEIGELAAFFLRREAKRKKKHFQSLSPDALEMLRAAEWPGNVRELENVIERAVLIGEGEELGVAHLSFFGSEIHAMAPVPASAAAAKLNPENLELPDSCLDLNALNQRIIMKALAKFSGNQSQAAKYLGLSRGAFRNRINSVE